MTGAIFLHQTVEMMDERIKLLSFAARPKWIAVREDARIVAEAETYQGLADELNRRKIENAIVLAPAA